MRKALSALTVLAAVVLLSPAPPTTAADRDADRADQTARVARVTIRDQVIQLTNNRRREARCNPVRKNAALSRAAQKHSRKMAAAERLDHQLPGEPSLGTRVTRAGYRGWTLLGENIAWNVPTAAAVVRAWMNSPSHRRNILDCRFKHIGVGYVLDDDGQPYWTQDFGRK
jgi:uncharacterized protein YkwD